MASSTPDEKQGLEARDHAYQPSRWIWAGYGERGLAEHPESGGGTRSVCASLPPSSLLSSSAIEEGGSVR